MKMIKIGVITGLCLTSFSVLAQTSATSSSPAANSDEPLVTGPNNSVGSQAVKNYGEIVEKKSVIRVVDKEMGNVCYVAHGASYDSGVGIFCMKLQQ